MNRTNTRFAAKTVPNDCSATLPSTPVLAYPPLPVADDGCVRLGGQAPMFQAHGASDNGQVRLGGQAPMFCPELIADNGLVRLGGQSPIF